MISRKSTFFLGIFIFLIPFLGFPSFWKTIFVTLSGATLVLLSVKIVIPRKGFKNKIKKERITPVYVENIPVYNPPVVEKEPVVNIPEIKTEIKKPAVRRRSSANKSPLDRSV